MAPPRPDESAAADALARAEAWGVDLSLVRENLRLSPTARAEQHAQARELALELRTSMLFSRERTQPDPPTGR